MYKQTTFIITAAILLTAAVALALYTVSTANAQSNNTSAGGSNMTSTNSTKAKITVTNPITGVTIGTVLRKTVLVLVLAAAI